MTLRTSSTSSSWRSAIFSAVLLIAGGLFVGMALMEGILRLFPSLLSVELQQVVKADPDNLGITHPYIGYLHKPNNTLVIGGRDFRAPSHTDGHGFRNTWPWPEKAEVVTLGDSVTFGYGVEDSQAWPALVAKALRHDRLINLGLIGAGPQQYLRVYETFGTKLHPKLLLVGFLARNDFWDAEKFDDWVKSGAAGNYMVWRDFGRPRSTSLSLDQPVGDLVISLLWRGHLLASKSRLYNLLLYVRKQLVISGPSEKKTFQAPDETRLELDLGSFISQTKDARAGNSAFDVTVEALRRLHSIASANGTNVLIILQPGKEEVYLPLMGKTNLDTDPGSSLRVLLTKLGIPYIDLLPDFRSRAAKGEVLFFETDGHPNARGYALIAELVVSHIKDNAKIYGLKD